MTRHSDTRPVLGIVALMAAASITMAGCPGAGDDNSLSDTPRTLSIQPAPPADTPPPATDEEARPMPLKPANSTTHRETAPPTTSPAIAPQQLRPPARFAGWPVPTVALFVTGRQHGYIEPCGCTGLENQLGGLMRRHTALQEIAARGWPTVALDAGNQVRRFGRQAEIKFQFTLESLRKMDYAAIGFGPDDLRLPAFDLATYIATDDASASPFLSANCTIVDPEFTRTYRVIESGGKKIGVTSIVGLRQQKEVTNDSISFVAAETALADVWPKMAAEQCDWYVLLAQASLDESRQLAQRFPGFHLVVTAGGAGEPTLIPETIEGTQTQMIQVGVKGMYAGVVGLFDDAATPIRYQRIPLDHGFQDSPDMMELFVSYQKQLESLGFDGLGLRPVVHPSGRSFVGTESCVDCHDREFDIWKNGLQEQGGPHAHATESLVHPPNSRGDIARHFDPECLSCHVTGWNPQQFYLYESGFVGLAASPSLHGNGCENCHGPGDQHVAAENGDVEVDEDEITRRRNAMRLTFSRAEQQCLACHDLDNSPDFHEKGAFLEYWKRIEH